MAEKRITDKTLAEIIGDRKEFSAILMLADVGSCIRARDAMLLLDGALKLTNDAQMLLQESGELVNLWYSKTQQPEAEDLMFRVIGAKHALEGKLQKKGKQKPGCTEYVDKALIESAKFGKAAAEIDEIVRALKEQASEGTDCRGGGAASQ